MTDIDFIRYTLSDAEIWGQLAEEAAELAQAALKMQRLYTNNRPRKDDSECRAAVIEEHADLALCFKILDWDDKEERKQIMEQKIHRWAEHLKSKGI